MIGPIYFWKISNNWIGLFLCGYVQQMISVISALFLPESPRFLIEQNRIDEAHKSFKSIAKWNQIKLTWDSRDFTKDGSRFTNPDRLGTEGETFMEDKIFIVEIINLPLSTTEAGIHDFMS